MKTLEATKAAANFARVLDAVRDKHESFAIVKKGVACAYLVPVVERGTSSHELADDLAEAELSNEDRRAWAGDISKARKALKPLKNPWH